MNFFPIPYPDELLYSILARYCIRSGNLSEIHNFEDLFGTRNAIAVIEIPTKIDALIDNLPEATQFTSDYLIQNHTLFPYFAAFIPRERAGDILELMKSNEGAISYLKTGLVASSISLQTHFRFCPICYQEDMELYGESYWHRSHQAVGVHVCIKHRMPLYNSSELIRGGNRQRFINASGQNCILEKELTYPEDVMKKLIWMADDINELLNSRYNFQLPEWFANQFRVKLIEKGYARLNNFIHQKILRQDFEAFYGEDCLELFQSLISDKGQGWLASLVRNNNRITHPLRYLLVARFLGISVYDLFNTKLLIQGQESRECKTIETSQKHWEERLVELTTMNLSIREIAAILNVTPNTIRRAVDRLGIPHFWKYNGGGQFVHKKYEDTDVFKDKRKKLRETWSRLHVQFPDMSSNQIRKNNDTLYAWLLKHDREWLDSNHRKLDTKPVTVDWNKRDEELLPKVVQVVEELLIGKPQRVCWTTIGSKLGISGWLSMKKEKLPLTKVYVESQLETYQEFQIRKIQWAINILENIDKEVTLWNVIETAGVKKRYLNVISKEVFDILMDKGYSIELD